MRYDFFLKTKEFADTVKGADNYFIIISREKLSQLPYSVDEIYGLRENSGAGKYHNPKRVYNEMYRIFGKIPDPKNVPELIIKEWVKRGKKEAGSHRKIRFIEHRGCKGYNSARRQFVKT